MATSPATESSSSSMPVNGALSPAEEAEAAAEAAEAAETKPTRKRRSNSLGQIQVAVVLPTDDGEGVLYKPVSNGTSFKTLNEAKRWLKHNAHLFANEDFAAEGGETQIQFTFLRVGKPLSVRQKVTRRSEFV